MNYYKELAEAYENLLDFHDVGMEYSEEVLHNDDKEDYQYWLERISMLRRLAQDETYTRLPFPDYQEYMERDDWDEAVPVGDSDMLVPTKWIE